MVLRTLAEKSAANCSPACIQKWCYSLLMLKRVAQYMTNPCPPSTIARSAECDPLPNMYSSLIHLLTNLIICTGARLLCFLVHMIDPFVLNRCVYLCRYVPIYCFFCVLSFIFFSAYLFTYISTGCKAFRFFFPVLRVIFFSFTFRHPAIAAPHGTTMAPSHGNQQGNPAMALHVYLTIHSFIHSFIPSFIPSFLHSFIPSFLHSFIPSFLHSFIPSFLHSFIPSFLHSFIPSFLHSFIPSFLHSFIPSSLHSFIPSFLPSFLPSFVPSVLHSFIPSFLPSFIVETLRPK